MKILIAEDDLVFQVLLRKAMDKWGYETVLVPDGEQAWKELTSGSGPRLAILDWVMPRADGLEVCRKVRSQNLPYYVYIILLTARTDAADLVKGLEAGADDYLVKPVNLHELKLRLRAGSRVLDSEEQYRVIAETASDGIVSLTLDHTIDFANNAAGAIFGYPAADLIGKNFSVIASALDRQFTEKCATATPVEIGGRRRDGSEMLLEISFSQAFERQHKRVFTAVIRDVTRRRLMERQRAQAQKLESLGQLAAGIAHEINTPIQYIGDNGKFLEDAFRDLIRLVEPASVSAESHPVTGTAPAPALPEAAGQQVDVDFLRDEIPKAISELLQGVDQVARIVRAMKEFSHPGSVQATPVDLNHAIQSTILVSKSEWKYVAEVLTDLDEHLPHVPCLAGELNQVMLNLIVNAAHAISGVTGRSGQKGTIRISTRQQEKWIEIRVSDTGTGIPEAIRSRVFDPFFTTKEVGKGTGQGLAIAHSVIVQTHRGTIHFESEVGVGTTFVIRLPLESRTEEAVSGTTPFSDSPDLAPCMSGAG